MTKNSRKLLPTAIAVLLLMTVMCAVGSAASLQLSKESIPPGATYTVGDTINYELIVTNTHGTCDATLDVWDDYPNGTSELLADDVVIPPGGTETYYTSYVTTGADIPQACNDLRVTGTQCGQPAQLLLGTCNDVTGTPPVYPGGDEFWAVEWFQTNPHQYTQFNISERFGGEKYLLTSAFYAPESCIHLWDGHVGAPELMDAYTGERLKFWNNDSFSESDIYMNPVCQTAYPGVSDIKLHGTFGEGAGDFDARDSVTGLRPENPPYTDPIAPFYPQANQSPMKDFLTFNPAIMDHNEGYPELNFLGIEGPEKEKLFKRMWYEKEWFKDDNKDGYWDVVLTKPSKPTLVYRLQTEQEAIHDALADGYRLEIHNDYDGVPEGDIYGPAIIQEFSYMFLDQHTMPQLINHGSSVLIPMAHNDTVPGISDYAGLNSFDADGDGARDALRVESEATLGFDIDQDTVIESMDTDDVEVSGDETVVLVLGNKYMDTGDELEYFDTIVELVTVHEIGATGHAIFNIKDNEGDLTNQRVTSNVDMVGGQIKFFYRAMPGNAWEKPTFYLKLISADAVDNEAIVEVGRMFGQTGANIGGSNPYWNQKAFMVDGVFYNVVAIKAKDDTIKYITFRQKLPKDDIKLYGKHLTVWDIGELLPEMAPLCDVHDVMEDVQSIWSWPPVKVPYPTPDVCPLNISYIDEKTEERFIGELKEIYWENGTDEFWAVEWFESNPHQYTEFHINETFPGEKYLLTSAFYAPQSCIHLWDGHAAGADPELMDTWTGERLKFWFNATNNTPLYIDPILGQKVYGTFGEGAGDFDARDSVTGLRPENPPYTDPIAPFYPQADQSPRKDFVTFNPAIMDHNEGYPELNFLGIEGPEKEKLFKRMWYEKEWFKDDNKDGYWDVVLTKPSKPTLVYRLQTEQEAIHDALADGYKLEIHNDYDGVPEGDIYGPAIIQEFSYMFLDQHTMPQLINHGSSVLIPMAHNDTVPGVGEYAGLNSFDADNDTMRDALRVESEATLGFDIDQDSVNESMDTDDVEVSGDETVVLVLGNKYMDTGDELEYFDTIVELVTVHEIGATGHAIFNIKDNEGDLTNQRVTSNVDMVGGQIKFFYRAMPGNAWEKPTFYLKLISADAVDNEAIVEVGRMFGQTGANIGGSNPYWNQKAFMVDGVFYNVVAIKAKDDTIKYITFRQKLPKDDIKLYGKHLTVWDIGDLLPEMAPLCDVHDVMEDVQSTWTDPPQKIGNYTHPVNRLEIKYTVEETEVRFKGELKEIYWENETSTPPEAKRLEGDVTDTGLPITGADAQLVAQHIVGTTTLTGEDAQAADVNDDLGGVTPHITGADLQLIKQYIVGTISVFPGGQYIP